MTGLLKFNEYCCPLIALLSSNGADLLVEKNQLNFADLLSPFCSTVITIKVNFINKFYNKVII